MADNDRLDRIEELIEANWKVIKANTDLITRMAERQAAAFWAAHSRQQRTQRQLDQLSRDVATLLASVQGHVAQPHPPAHAGENPAPPRTAGE